MSLHSNFFIIDFDEAADMQCWHYFSYTYFWCKYLVGMTCSQVTGTDASCILYIICSQFITFEQVTLYSAYCAWFVALLASPDTVLLRACLIFVLAQFDCSFYIKVQFGLPLICAKLALRAVIMSFHRCLSLLLRLKIIASI